MDLPLLDQAIALKYSLPKYLISDKIKIMPEAACTVALALHYWSSQGSILSTDSMRERDFASAIRGGHSLPVPLRLKENVAIRYRFKIFFYAATFYVEKP
jgi:hypothetical protein